MESDQAGGTVIGNENQPPNAGIRKALVNNPIQQVRRSDKIRQAPGQVVVQPPVDQVRAVPQHTAGVVQRNQLRLAEHPACIGDVNKFCEKTETTNFAVLYCLQYEIDVS